MASAASKTFLTPPQYLALERRSETRHEYFRGEMIEMAGASREHNLIVVNFTRLLANQLVDRPCENYAADMRVLIAASGLYTYPDVVVVCGEPQFLDADVDTLLNPTVLIEVQSPSTAGHDRETKFPHYRLLPSLREFLAVSQRRVLVEHYRRLDGGWHLEDYWRRDDVLRLESIGCELPLREVYAKVDVEDGPGLVGTDSSAT